MLKDIWKTVKARAAGGAEEPKERLFCSQPFLRYEILGGGADRGEVFPCCQSWLKKSFGNMSDKPVADVWNGRDAQEIRRSILDNSFRYCRGDVCPYLQRVDGPVQRVEDVTDERLLEIIQEEMTVLPFGPSDIICCFDQSCNLSCPTCRPRLIMETQHADAIVDIQQRLESEALGDAKLLYITGSGDPFGSPFFRRWLQTMKPASMPNLECIHLHTNGLLWTERAWEGIPAETRALVRAATISVDAATPETYAENRRGGDFPTLLERLAFIADLRRNGPLDCLEIHMTVQVNNVREMPAFVELGRRHACDRVTFHQLLDWGSFTPEEFERRAIQQPTHPEHRTLLDMLADERLDDPLVYLSNLTDLRQQALASRSAAAVGAAE
jgi:pyruvate-formate lyase-activating enzyme